MASKRFVVAPRCRVHFNGRLWGAGQEIPDLPPSKLKEHLRTGYMVDARSPQAIETADTLPPGTTIPVPIGDDGLQGKAKPIEIPQPKFEAPKVSSIWALDPDGLKGKTVEELNVIVLERDSKLAPFDTAEEAVVWLTQDFKEPVKA